MKRIHYLLLGLLVSLTIAAVSPGLPPTRIAPGANTTVVTNGVNSFTISSSVGAMDAQLDGTNVFTGTNTFPAASFYPANNIGMRVLWACPSNIFLPTLTVNGTANATNNGDYVNTTSISIGTIPPLLSSNSMIIMTGVFLRTNANTTAGSIYFYIGSNTNFTGGVSTFFPTAVGSTQPIVSAVLSPGGSMTNWVQGISFQTPLMVGTQPFFDGTVSNTIYIGCTTATSFTNALIYGLRLVEFYGP